MKSDYKENSDYESGNDINIDSEENEEENLIQFDFNKKNKNENIFESEEEVFSLNEKSDDETEIQSNSEKDEENEWGNVRNYYGDDKEEDEDFVKDALKQQNENLKEVSATKFIDKSVFDKWKNDNTEINLSSLKVFKVFDDKNKFDQFSDLEKKQEFDESFPEFLLLIKEFQDMKEEWIKKKTGEKKSDLKFAILSSYLASIALYFAIFIENLANFDFFRTMKDEKVLKTVMSFMDYNNVNFQNNCDLIDFKNQTNKQTSINDNKEEKEEDIFENLSVEKKKQNVNLTSEIEESDSSVDIDINKKYDLKSLKNKKKVDFEDLNLLEIREIKKNNGKLTLNFYSSKINKSLKNDKPRFSGDMDLPFKDRFYIRQNDYMKKFKTNNESNNSLPMPDNNVDLTESDYYEDLKKKKLIKKSLREEAHELALREYKKVRLSELSENKDENSKRAINYQILKNKGLTPFRKKENKNSRVKKRKKYEKAKIKLKSINKNFVRDDITSYEGEKTGIKKNLIKSKKLT